MANKEYSHAKEPGIVSILTLDRLDLTKKAVNSVLENSVENINLVFLDNGSKDGTLNYLYIGVNMWHIMIEVFLLFPSNFSDWPLWAVITHIRG